MPSVSHQHRGVLVSAKMSDESPMESMTWLVREGPRVSPESAPLLVAMVVWLNSSNPGPVSENRVALRAKMSHNYYIIRNWLSRPPAGKAGHGRQRQTSSGGEFCGCRIMYPGQAPTLRAESTPTAHGETGHGLADESVSQNSRRCHF